MATFDQRINKLEKDIISTVKYGHVATSPGGGILSVAQLSVGQGTATVLRQIATYSVTLAPGSVAATSVSEQAFTVNGLALNDKVFVNSPAPTAGVALASARVSAANTIAISWVNPTAGAHTPPTGTYLIVAIRS
jgi:hypothetical protein